MAEVKWIKLSTQMFEDEKIKLIESMPEADTILIIWVKLLSQAGKVNASGYIYLNEKIPYNEEMLATIFNRPVGTIRMALEVFSRFGMIEIDDRDFIAIANWEKHQNVEGMEKIREQNRIRKQKERESKRLQVAPPLGSEVLSRDSHATVTPNHAIDIDIDIDKDIDKDIKDICPEETSEPLSSGKKKRIFGKEEKEMVLAEFFVSEIRHNRENFKEPNLQKWADDFRKILDIDKRDIKEVTRLVRWVQKDDFEMVNVLSPDKLRKRYDALAIKMNKGTGAKVNGSKHNGKAEAAYSRTVREDGSDQQYDFPV